MVNGVNYTGNYQVPNINKEQVQQTLSKSTEAVSDTVESNALVNSTMGIDKGSVLLSVPLIMLIKFINNHLMSGDESKSLVGKIAKGGDFLSDKLKLDTVGSTLKTKSGAFKTKHPKIAETFKRFTKYFGDDYKAIPKSSLARTTKMSEKYADALVEMLEAEGRTIAKDAPINDILSAADDFLRSNPNKKQISGLRNMLKAADSQVGKTGFGKFAAKAGLKTKEIVFSTSDFLGKSKSALAMDLFSIILFAGVLKRAAKESKEAPKGEKLATFMHVLSEDYAPLMVMQPATSLLYKIGGNKYRGMSKESRDKLADIVKTANAKPVVEQRVVASLDDILLKSFGNVQYTPEMKQIAKMQQELLRNGATEDAVKALVGKNLDDAAVVAKNILDNIDPNIKSVIGLQDKLLKKGVKLADVDSLTGKTFEEASELASKLIKKTKVDRTQALKIAEIQKKALMKGASKADVETLTSMGVKEAKKAVKGFSKKLDLKFWERPLKWMGKILDTGLDTIKSPNLAGKIKNKAKGFAGGFGRLVLILFVLSSALQKPITKLCHKIFGEPKKYLDKQKAAEEAEKNKTEQTTEQTPVQTQQNNGETNLVKIHSNKKETVQNQEVPQTAKPVASTELSQNQEQTVSTKEQDVNSTEQDAIPASKLDGKQKGRYIPSTQVDLSYMSQQEKDLEAQVNEILKESDYLVQKARKLN